MISCKGIYYKDKKTNELAGFDALERPYRIQLFASEPVVVKYAVKYICDKYSPDGIDINMGCPVSKIVKNGEGSALMKTPALAYEIAAAAVDVSSVPVSVKIRSGWDEQSVNAVEVALLLEKAGVSEICVHGRTREQFYLPSVDLDVIKAVKENVKVRVVGNGDVTDFNSYKKMVDYTGCDAVMIGRAAIGRPWIFNEIKAGIFGEKPKAVDVKEVLVHHIELVTSFKSEKTAICEMRKHISRYIKGFSGAATLRERVNRATEKKELLSILEEISVL